MRDDIEDIVEQVSEAVMKKEDKTPPKEERTVYEELNLRLAVGEEVTVSGVKMTVVNVGKYSVILHPEKQSIFMVKGVPMALKKQVGNNIVLKLVVPGEIIRERPD